MRADIATRRARAPLPPIQVKASAPAPEIHTSFDDALLQVKTPNTQSSLSRPQPQPAAPAILISSQPTRASPSPRPELRPDSRRSNVGLRRRDLTHTSSTSASTVASSTTPLSLDALEHLVAPAQRTAQRARPPPPDAPRTELLASQQSQHLKPRKSRSSLFNLFSRPNVERARGAGQTDREPFTSTAPANFEVPPSPRRRLSRLPSRAPSRQPSVERILDRNQSTLSVKSHISQAQSAPDALSVPSQVLEVPKNPTSSQGMQRAKSSARTAWAPPPLFQAYPQSVKHSNPTLSGVSSDGATTKTHPSPPSSAQERPKSRPGTSRFGRPKSRKNDSTDGDAAEGLSFEAFSNGSASNKIYVLVTAGYLLQYAGEGGFDRLPEKVLQLTDTSVAFASDLIPGKHWVLQVVQSSANDPFKSAGTQRSFFHKFSMSSMSGLKRRNVSGMLMIFDSPDDMDSWMVAIRKEIERINGSDSSYTQTADQTGLSKSPIDQPAEGVLSHRYVALSRRTSTNLGPPSPLSPTSPTIIDSERTSGTTQVGAFSDITGEWSPRDAMIPYKIPPHASGHRSRENILDMPEPPIATPDAVDVPVSPSSSLDDADFEYLFPPTPGSKGQSSFEPSTSSLRNQPMTVYTNSAHYSLSRQNSVQRAASIAGEAKPAGQRVSTYNLLPAGSQRLSRQQSMPVLARQSSYPPPANSAHPKSSSSNPMHPIAESSTFFSARNSSALPSPPLASPTSSSASSRTPPSHWTNSPPGRQADRASLRPYMSAENLQQDAQKARQNIESADAVARRISARMSTLHHAASLESIGSAQRASMMAKSSYRSSHASSYNSSALGSLPEGVGAPDARRQSRMAPFVQSEVTLQSQPQSDQDQPQQQQAPEQPGSNNSSSSTSRRTSFRNSGMPIPLQTAASTTSSNQSTGAATSAPTLSSRQRAILALQGVSESAATTISFKTPAAESTAKFAVQRQAPSASAASTSPSTQNTRPVGSGRPMSIHVSSDRAPFLSANRAPRASVQAEASPVEPNSAPGNIQQAMTNKRESTLVPIVRPPSLASHRLRASGTRQMRMSGLGGSMGLPPPQPPPSMPLPMLPQEGAQKA